MKVRRTPLRSHFQQKFYESCQGEEKRGEGHFFSLPAAQLRLIQYYRKSINAVSRRLGHVNELTTITIYDSVLPQEDEDIADTMGSIMGEGEVRKGTQKYAIKTPKFTLDLKQKKSANNDVHGT